MKEEEEEENRNSPSQDRSHVGKAKQPLNTLGDHEKEKGLSKDRSAAH